MEMQQGVLDRVNAGIAHKNQTRKTQRPTFETYDQLHESVNRLNTHEARDIIASGTDYDELRASLTSNLNTAELRQEARIVLDSITHYNPDHVKRTVPPPTKVVTARRRAAAPNGDTSASTGTGTSTGPTTATRAVHASRQKRVHCAAGQACFGTRGTPIDVADRRQQATSCLSSLAHFWFDGMWHHYYNVSSRCARIRNEHTACRRQPAADWAVL
jgi:hypothetical protein